MITPPHRSLSDASAWARRLAVCGLAGLLLGCPPKGDDPPPDDDIEISDCISAVGTPDIACSAPPDTFDTTSLQGTAKGSAWDAWAWSSFAALNWPALASTDASAYPSGFVRGVPDLSQSFATADGTDATVWETFKEKRELFNDNATTDAWQDVTFDSQYAPSFLGGNVQPCEGIDEVLHSRVQAQPRIISQIAKTNSGDETAEVASPAQESQDALCAGYSTSTNPTLADCQMNFQPPPGGDGSTEFNASELNYRTGVGPRVFKGSPSAEGFIYYEVKLNYDYYRYVASNGLNDYNTAVQMSADNEIFLPYRTSAMAKPQGSANADAYAAYSAAATQTCYQDGLGNCSLSNAWGAVDASNPPQLGAIQLKAAWLPTALLDGEVGDYHTTEAVYYKDSASQPEGLCYDVEKFGLLGLHIIQRVHGGDAGAANGEGIGGTFIFATWEHESIADGSGYSYVNYPSDQGKDQENPPPYPNTAEGIQVSRLQAYPLATTAAVTSTAHGDLPSASVWQNYRLIGTQFNAIGSQADSQAMGQPYYLANLVIETNRGLQQFQGQAPYLRVTDHYSGKIPPPSGTLPSPHFSPSIANMVYGGAAVNMGGCMGCHGNAQSQGYTFSFVLLDGSKGTKPDTKDSVLIPPVVLPVTSAGS